ncbi:MAG: putative sulfate/molybdate transporter [Candidatus Bathyarchaeia archaeon]
MQMFGARRFEFSIRELAGAVGDFGTLIPFTVGYILFCGFDPSGLLVGIGLTNIVLGLIYGLPLPVQPKKVIGTVALAQRWSRSKVLGAGFAVGLVWVVLSFSRRFGDLLGRVPRPVVRGIQLGLAFTLALAAAEMMKPNPIYSLALTVIAFLLLRSRILPSSIFLVLFGLAYALATGSLHLGDISMSLSLPELQTFSLNDLFYGFVYAGFAQLFLTLTNAVVATVALIRDLFPDRTDVTPRNLIANMGVMNILTPFIGGMPLCHGAGGLAAQYLFGARTGGAILMEGLIEMTLGLLFAGSLLAIFTSFPLFVVGVMLFLASIELGKVSLKVEGNEEALVMLFTATVSTTFNIAVGFLSGLLLHAALEKGIIKGV